MNAENSKGRMEFLIDHIWWAFIAWIWYKNFLFRCLEMHSLKESRVILLVMILCCSAIGIVLEMKKQRNSISVIMNLLAGFGLYTVFAYLPIKRRLILITFIVAAILTVLYLLLILCHKIKNRRKFKKIIARRIIRALSGARNIICIGLAMIMILIGINAVFGTSLLRPSVAPAKQSNVEEQTIANNMETLLLLREDTWKTLSAEEKINVLQTVANIEQRYLGLPNELNVGASNLREGLAGYYSDSTHEIIVSMDCLLNDSSRELVDTICHEAYHSFQHRTIDAYDEASDEMKNLYLYYDATIYKEEFSNYIDGKEDLCSYYTQTVEHHSRLYASSATDEYFERINEYFLEFETVTTASVSSSEKTDSYQFVEDTSWYGSGIARYIDDNGLIGYVDASGKEITEPIFVYGSDMRHGIALVRENADNIYYIDSEGKRIGEEYADGYEFDFDRECAIVKTDDGNWGMINQQGELFYSGADKIEEFPAFSNITTAVIDGQAVLLRLKQEGAWSCEVIKIFEEYTDITYLCYGTFAMVTDCNGNKGVVCCDGEVIIPAEYESIDYEYISADGDQSSLFLFKLQRTDGSIEIVKKLY